MLGTEGGMPDGWDWSRTVMNEPCPNKTPAWHPSLPPVCVKLQYTDLILVVHLVPVVCCGLILFVSRHVWRAGEHVLYALFFLGAQPTAPTSTRRSRGRQAPWARGVALAPPINGAVRFCGANRSQCVRAR